MPAIDLTNVQKTSLATLYGKALDARVPDPILGDTLADEAVRKLGADFDFASLKLPSGGSVSLPVRAKQLDGWTRDFLAAHPGATVLHLGCGLDTRVHRVDPPAGVRWYDIDLPEIIELREQLYPARDGYEMIAMSLTDPVWLERVPADRPVLVVGEGLVMHVPTAEMVTVFERIVGRFPGGEFIFDCYAASTARFVSWGSKLGGSPVTLHSGLPKALQAQVPGLVLAESVPFLTLPDLVSRLGRNAVARGYFRLVEAGFSKNTIRHLRYTFPA